MRIEQLLEDDGSMRWANKHDAEMKRVSMVYSQVGGLGTSEFHILYCHYYHWKSWRC